MRAEEKLETDIKALRAERLNDYRQRGYNYLADAIQSSSDSQADLELIDVVSCSGREFQIEVRAYWGGKPKGDIRVIAEALPVPLKPLFGFIPIFFGGPCEDFIISPDGTFVDE